jgi:hypothetical protein
VRETKGEDERSACGQLATAKKTEAKTAAPPRSISSSSSVAL